tara:strand:- start:2383 stop:2664 length:282 start_codon:yes stop_codon:yes gene_type:complete
MKYLKLKTWKEEHSSIYKEIVSRFGLSDYKDDTKRAKHIATLKTEWEAKKYQRDREEDYPSIGDQLDMIYHAGQGGDNFQKAIKAVKDKYSKE